MARTNIIDIKDLPEAALDGTDRAEVRADGTRHLNLDALFNGQLETRENEIDDYPATTTSVNNFSHLKLAGNARQYRSRFTGTTSTLHDYFNFGGWDDQNYGRTEFQGPMVQGPHMFAYKLGTVLSAHTEPDEIAFLVEEGDTVQFLGSEFRVTFPPYTNDNMKLELVKEVVTA